MSLVSSGAATVTGASEISLNVVRNNLEDGGQCRALSSKKKRLKLLADDVTGELTNARNVGAMVTRGLRNRTDAG